MRCLEVADRLLPSPDCGPSTRDDDISKLCAQRRQRTENPSHFDCSIPDASKCRLCSAALAKKSAAASFNVVVKLVAIKGLMTQ